VKTFFHRIKHFSIVLLLITYRVVNNATFDQHQHDKRGECPGICSGVFRGGHGAMPPFGLTMKIFYRRHYMKRCVFAIFQQELQNSTMFDGLLRFKILEKWANLRFPLNIQNQKVFHLQAPDQGLCPWTPLGAPPPDSRYRLALRALAMAPLFAKS